MDKTSYWTHIGYFAIIAISVYVSVAKISTSTTFSYDFTKLPSLIICSYETILSTSILLLTLLWLISKMNIKFWVALSSLQKF